MDGVEEAMRKTKFAVGQKVLPKGMPRNFWFTVTSISMNHGGTGPARYMGKRSQKLGYEVTGAYENELEKWPRKQGLP